MREEAYRTATPFSHSFNIMMITLVVVSPCLYVGQR